MTTIAGQVPPGERTDWPDAFRGDGHAALRERNRALILRALLRYGPIANKDLSRLTRLAPATISAALQSLIEADLVSVVGPAQQTPGKRGGPRKILLDVGSPEKLVGAAVIGVYSRHAALLDLRGRVVRQVAERASTHHAGVIPGLAWTIAALQLLAQEAGLKPDDLVGVGVSVQGIVDSNRGIMWNDDNNESGGVAIAASLEAAFGQTVVVENAARSSAFSLVWGMMDREQANAMVLSVGTAIEAATIIGGQIHTGTRLLAGQLDHLVVQTDGPPCHCGRSGCLRTLASEDVIVASAYTQGSEALRRQLPYDEAGRPLQLGAAAFVAQAAAAGDPDALKILQSAAYHLGIAVAGGVSLLAPTRLHVLGTVPRLAGDIFAQALRDGLAQRISPAMMKHLQIDVDPADLPLRALVGAGALALDRFVYSPRLPQ